jgi:hypothetical protein
MLRELAGDIWTTERPQRFYGLEVGTRMTVIRLVTKMLRSYGRFGPSSLDPFLIRDRSAARRSLERILAWDFDRVVVAHGDVLESGGPDALRAGYAWLLAS